MLPLQTFKLRVLSACILLGTAVQIPLVMAQALPDAGQQNRDARTNSPAMGGALPRAESATAAPSAPAVPAMQVAASTMLPVKGFKFTGNKIFTAEQLAPLLQVNTTGGGVSFADLNAAVARVTEYYRANGYRLSRAYLPQQTSPDGIIQIAVLEGVYLKSKINNTSPVNTARIQSTVDAALCQGVANCVNPVVTDASTERALRLLTDMPGVSASAVMTPENPPGSMALAITTKLSSLPTTSVGLDNYGSKYTGIYRLSVSSDFNNLKNDGDQLNVSGSASDSKIWNAALSYSVLAGYQGTRMGLSFGHGQYLLGDVFAPLDSHGDANSLTAFAVHPIVRHREGNLYLRGSFDHRILKDMILGANVSEKNANNLMVSLYGDKVDGFGGGGYTNFNVGATNGNMRLKNAAAATNDANTAKTVGGFAKLSYALGRQQALSGPWTLYGSLSGQTASKNLDPSEKIGLGGIGGVKGYAAGEGGGDAGAIANVEIRHTRPIMGGANLTISTFVDRGWVKTNMTTWAGNTNTPTRALTSYGFGLVMNKAYDYSIRAIWGTHDTAKPSLVETASKSQFWLQANKSF